MQLVGLALVVLLTKLLAGKAKPADIVADTDAVPPTPGPSLSPSLAAGWLAAGIAVVGIAVGGYGLTRPSVARSAVPNGDAPIDRISTTIGDWTAKELPIDEEIPQILGYNKCTYRSYRNPLGYEMYVWVIYWSTAKSVKSYHHPDICMPNRGSDPLGKEELAHLTPGGRTLPLSFREFQRRNATDRQILVYWTQEGKSIWTPADEAIASDQLTYPFKWIAKRTGERPADAFDDRIVVLIGTPSWGAGAGPRTALLSFAGQLADEVYRVCPWADPGVATRE